MKKIIMAMAAVAAAFTMASCNKEQLTESEGTPVVGKDIITAYTESSLTKTSLDGDDINGYDVVWSEGDKIKIGGNEFTLIEGANTTSGKFQGTLPTEDGTYTACYPATYNGTDWPNEQTYTEGNITGSPMKASVTVADGKASGPLSFKNKGGILRLTLKGTATVSDIIVHAGGQVDLMCGGGVSLDNANGKVFHIALPEGTYPELLIQILTIDGLDIRNRMKSGRQLVIERSKITDVSLSNINSSALQGILPGEFSVADGSTVHFSKGNLRYTVDSGKWSFFDRQYDCGPSNYEDGHDREISLFTWGYNSTKSIVPDGNSGDNVNKVSPGHNLKQNQDWGSQIGIWGAWRTLTKAEWEYLFKTRTDAPQKYGYATVCGVKGLVILPDKFTDPRTNGGCSVFKPQSSMSSWTDNVYTSGGDWEAMEYAGAVFLPAGGSRSGSEISFAGQSAFYWSSTAADASNAYSVYFDAGNNLSTSYSVGRGTGYSVRLVSSTYTVTFDLNGKSGTAPQSIGNILNGSTITKPASPTAEGYTFTGWYKDAECTSPWNFITECVYSSITLYAGWTGGLISGKFSVSKSKQVYFSKGNLWADDFDLLHFEDNQWDSDNSYSLDHLSYFTWSSSVSLAVGPTGYGSNLFCDENHKVSVNGSSAPIYYALTKDEWKYLFRIDDSDINVREMKYGSPTHSCHIIYCGTGGLVIYPDDYNGDPLSQDIEYTEETFPEGCVFLPGAGWRDGITIRDVGHSIGFYWSSSADFEHRPYNVSFNNGGVSISDPGNKNNAFSIRLVANCE